jgi:hypothetical protein
MPFRRTAAVRAAPAAARWILTLRDMLDARRSATLLRLASAAQSRSAHVAQAARLRVTSAARRQFQSSRRDCATRIAGNRVQRSKWRSTQIRVNRAKSW